MFELNPEQRHAVEHGEGPLLVVAGPGSGKTRVITERIVYLLRAVAGLQPENILAVTFTNKAADEMKRRVSQALGDPPTLPRISTFHSFCFQVLQERHFGRRLLDQVDLWIFLRRRMAELGLVFYQKLAEPGAFLHDLNEFFSRCQDELIEPGDFEDYVERVEKEFLAHSGTLDPAERSDQLEEVQELRELARVFRNSRKLIEDAGRSSLGSLVSETVRLWDREPEVLARLRARFRYVLVDEFQDTNYAQVELLQRLAAPPYNITAVGDDDQAIYRFRGASHGAFEMFARAFARPQTVYLYRNYRSTRKILRSAGAVIARNTHELEKPAFETKNDEGCPVFLLESPDYLSEAAWITGEVERLASRGQALGDVAVLYRGHSYRDLLVEKFRRRKIPFAIRGLSILSAAILRDMLAYLNLVHSPHHNISLTRVLLAPRWRFPEDLALDIRKQASRDRSSLFEALEAMERTLLKQELENTGWTDLKKTLRDLSQAAQDLPITGLFDLLIARLRLAFLPGDPDQARVDAFRKFLAAWEEKSETRKLGEFIEYLQYFVEAWGKIEAPGAENAGSAVQMMTVHAAKGLEFPVVFVMSVARQRFPHREERPVIEFPDELRKGPRPPGNIHLEEERRLFYVAMTRAKERLYVSSVVQPGKKPSQFVDDLFSDPAVRARDIERVQVPAVGPDEGARLGAAVLLPERAHGGTGQARLFGNTPPANDSIHPNLEEWARQTPAIRPGAKLRLSATAIEAYRDCPLKFKLTHYLQVPTGPQAMLTFGNIMHQCVRKYFDLRRKALPRFEDVQEVYLRSWRDAGFEDAYQEQAYKKAGLDQLREFVEAHNAKAIPAGDIQFEEHFALDLGDVVLEGRIDQINPLGPSARGGDHSVELIDYKTGRPRTERDANRSLQLSVYALAARRQLNLDPARLTFYHLANNQTVSTVRTEKDLEEAVEEIREVAGKIRALLFEPTPGYVCKWCDFVPICPAHEEKF